MLFWKALIKQKKAVGFGMRHSWAGLPALLLSMAVCSWSNNLYDLSDSLQSLSLILINCNFILMAWMNLTEIDVEEMNLEPKEYTFV